MQTDSIHQRVPATLLAFMAMFSISWTVAERAAHSSQSPVLPFSLNNLMTVIEMMFENTGGLVTAGCFFWH